MYPKLVVVVLNIQSSKMRRWLRPVVDIEMVTGKVVDELSSKTRELDFTGGRFAAVELLITVAWFPP